MDRRSFLRGGAAAAVGLAWLPVAHVPWGPSRADRARTGPLSAAVARRVDQHLAWWSRPGGPAHALRAARAANPEYDLMARLFTTLAFTDVALRDPGRRPACVAAIDRILADTLEQTERHGPRHWLLPYGRARPFRWTGQRSVFVDGELAMMLGARRWLGDEGRWRRPFEERVRHIEAAVADGPVHMAESYPDECWTFCNALSMASLKLADALDGTHRTLPSRWIASVRDHLLDPQSGLLVSSCTWDGHHGQGPEGSSLWFSLSCMRLVAPDFAARQYGLAKAHLARSWLGFGWSREWPPHLRGAMDVDSGPVVPGFDASPAASGLALTAARAFDDTAWWNALVSAVNLAGFPDRIEGVGGAVLLHGLVHGTLWDEILDRRTA